MAWWHDAGVGAGVASFVRVMALWLGRFGVGVRICMD